MIKFQNKSPKGLDKLEFLVYTYIVRLDKEFEMKIRIANKDNMKVDICDICNTAILKGEEYVIQYASWNNPDGKLERVSFKLHKYCK